MEDTNATKQFVTLSVQGFGDIKLEFFEKDAPKAVENFIGLAKKGYYDGVTFHRIIKGFMIQGGDPTGTGAGGESIFGDTFADELNPDTDSYKAGYAKGVLAMANRGPNTNGSQFFIMLENYPLPHNYTIFGRVIAGQDVVDKIGAVPTNPGDSPKDKVVITKAVVTDK
jgi:cyclophilin family peptidyl-prolyl cis-trans isomerase